MRCGRGERGRTETVQPRCATRREAGSAWPRVPLPARTGHHKSGRLALARGAKREGKGAGATRRAGRCCAPPFRVNVEGKGHVPPFRANGVARRGKGKRAGATRRGGAVCPHTPPFHANEEGEAGGVACPRVSPVRVFLPSHALTPHEWGGVDKRDGAGAGPTWRGGAVCPRTPPVEGRAGADTGWWGGVLPYAPLPREGKGRAGGSHAPFPHIQARPSRKRRGRGQALVRPLFARMGCRGQGKRQRRRHALVRPPSTQTWWRGQGEGRAGEVGGRQALCTPYLRAKGAAAVNAGEGRGGQLTLVHPSLRAMQGLWPASPFRANEGVGRRGEGGEETWVGLLSHTIPYECTNCGGKQGGEGKAGGRVVLDPVAEVKRACHICTSADVAAFHWHATPPFPPSYRVPPDLYRIGTQEDRPYIPYITRRPVHAQTRVHQERGSARGHAAPSLSPSPRHPVRAERERTRVHPSPTSLRPSPSPPTLPLSAPPIRTEGGTPLPSFPIPAEGVTPPPLPLPPVPPFPPRPRKGAHKGTLPPAPPFPICAEEVRTRGTPPPLPVATGPSLDRAPPYVRARHPRPNPFAFAQKRGAPHATPSPSPLTSPPCTRGKGAREVTQPPAPSFPVALGPSPSPLTSPPRLRGKWAREGTPLRSYPSAFAWKGGGPHAAPSPRRPWPLPLPFGRAAPSTRARHLWPHLSP
ncbi:hypothetical protein EDB85DRAFT_1892838 [Lactarius pseudohatsudake]|nr:hypothetical protein EDB85DRAFT_1892838 [Lactarius pseudohatsudake]